MEKLNLKIGDYEICPVPTGIFGLDGGAMFGTVPKVLWEKAIPPDDQNRIPMEARALLLKSEKYKILIDAGNGADFVAKYGDKLGNKFAEMYKVNSDGLKNSLRSHGLGFEDITHVILTHLHFDHCGGAVTEVNGQLVPTFPNAKYFVQQENLKTASHPNIREKASYFPSNYQPLQKAGVLTLLDGPVENLLPNISVGISNGHTTGHQYVKITDQKTTLVYCGDMIPTSAHIRLAWVMGYDLEPLKLIHEKEQLLSQAADNKWYLYFEHDPFCDAALVQRQGSDFAKLESFRL